MVHHDGGGCCCYISPMHGIITTNLRATVLVVTIPIPEVVVIVGVLDAIDVTIILKVDFESIGNNVGTIAIVRDLR